MGYWTIAIYGTDTFYQPNSSSLVSLATLGVTDPMTDSKWLKLSVAGMGPKNKPIKETDERIGGIAVHRKKQLRVFDCKLAPYVFPDDMDDLELLYAELNFNYIYLYRGTYDFTNFSIHTTGNAISVACISNVEDNFDDGTKDVTLTFRKTYPI